jgi:pyruvate ferredoxin oxidoreductase delta subunit
MHRQEGLPPLHHVLSGGKHMAIEMLAVSATGQLMTHKGESAALGQAYQG